MLLEKLPCVLVDTDGYGILDKYNLVENTYFKYPYNINGEFISGRHLPKPGNDYYFRKCNFHPGLKEELLNNYVECVFEDCEMPW